MFLRRGIVHRLVERYRNKHAILASCPCCRGSYLRILQGPAFVKPCPQCEEPLLSIGHIGIDQAESIIATNRTTSTGR